MAMQVQANNAPQTPPQQGAVTGQQDFFQTFHKLPDSRFKSADSGLKVAVVKQGEGEQTTDGMRLKVRYTGWLENGEMFDSSEEKGKPFEFTLGKGQVIKGWEEGLKGMKPGEKRQLVIPADQAYGDRPMGKIPPGSTLVFNVELVSAEAAASHNPKGNLSITA